VAVSVTTVFSGFLELKHKNK